MDVQGAGGLLSRFYFTQSISELYIRLVYVFGRDAGSQRAIYLDYCAVAGPGAAINNMLTLITSAAVVNSHKTFITLKYSRSMRLSTEKLQSQFSRLKQSKMYDV